MKNVKNLILIFSVLIFGCNSNPILPESNPLLLESNPLLDSLNILLEGTFYKFVDIQETTVVRPDGGFWQAYKLKLENNGTSVNELHIIIQAINSGGYHLDADVAWFGEIQADGQSEETIVFYQSRPSDIYGLRSLQLWVDGERKKP